MIHLLITAIIFRWYDPPPDEGQSSQCPYETSDETHATFVDTALGWTVYGSFTYQIVFRGGNARLGTFEL